MISHHKYISKYSIRKQFPIKGNKNKNEKLPYYLANTICFTLYNNNTALIRNLCSRFFTTNPHLIFPYRDLYFLKRHITYWFILDYARALYALYKTRSR